MGPNLTDKAMKRATRSVSALHEFTRVFDKQTHIPATSSAHKSRSDEDDVTQVVSVLFNHTSSSSNLILGQLIASCIFVDSLYDVESMCSRFFFLLFCHKSITCRTIHVSIW